MGLFNAMWLNAQNLTCWGCAVNQPEVGRSKIFWWLNQYVFQQQMITFGLELPVKAL